ncbi:MAG: phosphotransferase [Rhodospirillales bacterium]|nr:phosphotransferase [Rhodospirillales bacterium]
MADGNDAREHGISDFLNGTGWAGAQRSPVAGDASFRRYHRLTRLGNTAILMDAPPPHENVGPFADLSAHLISLGFSAPRILAEDRERGLLLIEDFGDRTFARQLSEGSDPRALYETAVDLLIALHRLPHRVAVPTGLAPYDDDALLAEAFLLTDWYLPSVLGRLTAPDIREEFAVLWRDAFSHLRNQERCLVLRDYFAENLMLLDGRDGVAGCGLLDFQDALAGPGAYDLASLIEDARRDMDPELARHLISRYEDAFPSMDVDAFRRAFDILAAQRHTKVIGIFTRLCRRDGKSNYLVHVPRLWRLLEKKLENPALAPLKRWFDQHVPNDRREVPQCQPATSP